MWYEHQLLVLCVVLHVSSKFCQLLLQKVKKTERPHRNIPLVSLYLKLCLLCLLLYIIMIMSYVLQSGLIILRTTREDK